MAFDFTHFKLYDTDVQDLLWSRPSDDLLTPRLEPEDSEGVFDSLQEKELIYAITQLNYPRIYSLLRNLSQPLCLPDAMAACLCALNGTPKLMNTLLDHCPPIPEFQFQGVGQVSSLLCVAAEYDRDSMLNILLSRGADPNGGPVDAKSPVEAAFCSHAYSSLERLLKIPGLQLSLTDEMLYAWGALTSEPLNGLFDNPNLLWNCQLLMEKLTGESPGLFDPLPVPPQLRLGHALYHANFELAAHICNTRPLTDMDISDVLAHYTPDRLDCTLLREHEFEHTALSAKRSQEIRFLCQLLRCRSDLLQKPPLRSAVALAALSMPEEDPFLSHWVRQMEEGPVLLPQVPIKQELFLDRFLFEKATSVDCVFFARWEQRLGQRLVPTMDINTPGLGNLPDDAVGPMLERIRFVGVPPADALSPMALQALRHAPENMLPSLLQTGGPLAQEHPRLLLDFCQTLPPVRRNQILPFIQKSTDYQL